MDSLVPIFVIGILSLVIYRLVELFVRRKERLEIIERISDANSELLIKNLSLPVVGASGELNNLKPSFFTLRISLLLIGLGVGLLVAFFIQLLVGGTCLSTSELSDKTIHLSENLRVIYSACVCVFGGLGLLISYLLEKKK